MYAHPLTVFCICREIRFVFLQRYGIFFILLHKLSTGMSEKENFYTKYLSKLNLYVVVIAVFMIITFVVGDSNLYVRYTYDDKIRSLEREIKHYRKEIETNRRKLEDLHTSKEGLERYAREEFYMKRENEDIFIIQD